MGKSKANISQQGTFFEEEVVPKPENTPVIIPFEIDRDYPVYMFCKENGIDCTWDFRKEDRTQWTEIRINGKLVMQIQHTATVEQFKKIILLINKSYGNPKVTDVSGNDFWFAMGGSRLFKEFMQAHGHIFLTP